jgi:diguanylate cyclase (GGDEF)-like protein
MRAEQWRQACAAVRVANADGVEVSSTVSLGVTLVRVGSELIEDALERVDRALYSAKRAGRDRVVVEA